MSFGLILGFAFGLLAPISLLAACAFEYLARKMSADPRCDKTVLEKRKRNADVGLAAAWLLLAAAFLCFRYLAPDAEAFAKTFQQWMTWMLGALLLLDIIYLFLRRSRPRQAGKKKNFWEI